MTMRPRAEEISADKDDQVRRETLWPCSEGGVKLPINGQLWGRSGENPPRLFLLSLCLCHRGSRTWTVPAETCCCVVSAGRRHTETVSFRRGSSVPIRDLLLAACSGSYVSSRSFRLARLTWRRGPQEAELMSSEAPVSRGAAHRRTLHPYHQRFRPHYLFVL